MDNEERRRKLREKYRRNKEKIRKYQNEWSRKNYSSEKRREEYERTKEKTLKQGREKYGRVREVISNYKKNKSCEICGYNEHFEILQFHHKNKGEKEFSIGRVNNKTKHQLIEEMKKCMLICPNCHSIIHFKEKGVLLNEN